MGTNPANTASIIPGVSGTSLQQYHRATSGGNAFTNAVKNWWNNLPGSKQQPGSLNTNTGGVILYNANKQPISGFQTSETFNGVTTTKTNPIAFDASGNKYQYDTSSGQYIRDQSSAFSNQPSSTNGLDSSVLGKAPQPFANNLVGLNMSSAQPKALEMKTAMQLFSGLPNDQVIASMQKIGYQYVQGPRGGTFVLSGQGDPNYKPTQGNVTKMDNGATIIEGQPLQNGKRQYSYISGKIKKGGNFNSYVQQDAQGNWVRVVVPAYDYGGGGGRRRRGGSQPNYQHSSQQQSKAPTIPQLVNLRVNYG